MEGTFSNEFKKNFILIFTKELISHSVKMDMIKLQKIIETRERKQSMPLILQPSFPIRREEELKKLNFSKRVPSTKPFRNKSFIIPEPKLPLHLEYLKPLPTSSIGIDLFKITPLIKDPAVKIITGSPDEKVVVSGIMGTKPTGIFLSKEDIDKIINVFSEQSKIPINEGIYKVVLGNLILSAIISPVVGSRFVIKKNTIIPPQRNI